MSDKTPEQIEAERKSKADKINARIEELKSFEGKSFMPNSGKGLPVTVKRYAGIFVKDGQAVYTFEVETPGHANWNAPATEFLANHTMIPDTAKTETSDEPI